MRKTPAAISSDPWVEGNAVALLENGNAFFPRLFDAISSARRELLLETFILFEDRVGLQLGALLVAAARRGVEVDLTVDGWGTPGLSEAFVRSLVEAGVRLHVFDPGPRPFGWRPWALHRLHRKIVVVDGAAAFVGGINFSADHLTEHGPGAKQDYAVEVHGPLVAGLRLFLLRQLPTRPRPSLATPAPAGEMRVRLAVRDNHDHPDDIERHYRAAIRAARERVLIANAYFFPGYRLVRELRLAARRGVDVRLILQGRPDMPIARAAASTLYLHLLSAGVRIFEYRLRPLHGKVALADQRWSTVGSSNLDPLSLALNLEANLEVDDLGFNAMLHAHLSTLMLRDCREVLVQALPRVRGLALLRTYLAFHLMRKFPGWARGLPRPAQQLRAATLAPRDAG
jgi:cardiolipin synthase